MPSYLRRLLRRAFGKRPKPVRAEPPRRARPSSAGRRPIPNLPLPFLTSQDGLFEKLPPSGSEYGLFHRLPLEIRRLILAEAFGHRTIHMDLRFDHPLVRRMAASSSASSEESRHCDLGSKLVPDKSRPLGWQWFSCVCHRRVEWKATERADMFVKATNTIGLYDDECLKGNICSCSEEGERGLGRESCFLGVMGWLLSCRSACAEGLDAIFSTSTFHISGLDLLLHLPRLVHPRLLEKITSLELLWGDHERRLDQHPLAQELWGKSSTRHQYGDGILQRLCQIIPKACPNVQRLHISLQFWVAPHPLDEPRHGRVAHFEHTTLGPIQDMLCGLESRKEFNVTIPGGIWRILFRKYHDLHGPKFVCELDTEVAGRFQMPLGADAEANYWICSGWDDQIYLGSGYSWEYHGLWNEELPPGG